MLVIIEGARVRHCAKVGCLEPAIDRHHKGSEAMWLRQFKRRKRTKHYQAFKARYEEYRIEDTDVLCRGHHEEISSLNGELIMAYQRAHDMPACRYWTWEEAEKLMKFLRRKYAAWLKVPKEKYPIKDFLKVPLARG